MKYQILRLDVSVVRVNFKTLSCRIVKEENPGSTKPLQRKTGKLLMTFILLFSNDEKREQFEENVKIQFFKKIDEFIYTRKTAI